MEAILAGETERGVKKTLPLPPWRQLCAIPSLAPTESGLCLLARHPNFGSSPKSGLLAINPTKHLVFRSLAEITQGWPRFNFYAPPRNQQSVGYIRYDGAPAAQFFLYDTFAVLNSQDGTAHCHSSSPAGLADLERLLDASDSPPPSEAIGSFVRNESLPKESHREAVERIKEYIADGHVYQANLTSRFVVESNQSAADVFYRLLTASPAPFAAYLNFGGTKVVSASPERFLRISGRYAITEPMKGTRPRGQTESEDAQLRKELLESSKDSAENLMICDMARNDLGRVAAYGTVWVESLREVWPLPTAWQMTSRVSCELRPEVTLGKVLQATFPPASMTGAPKVRATEILRELEPVPRGIYSGAIGHCDALGNADFAVAIRGVYFEGDAVYVHAGGGIVYDSDPDAEYEELLLKARAPLQSLGVVV